MRKHIVHLWNAERVLMIALVSAAVSCAFVPIDTVYLSYIDLKVLCLLFALMTVVQGLEAGGLFRYLSGKLFSGRHFLPVLVGMLTFLPFFLSMLMTNDVALIACVPFTFVALRQAHADRLSIRICVLQTVAANLGSMATPVGNPQNLYLYSHYSLSAGEFLHVMLPLTLVSMGFLLCCVVVLSPRQTVEVTFDPSSNCEGKRLIANGLLFVLCLMAVFRVVAYTVACTAVAIYQLVFDRGVLKRVDYGLLGTFLCFYIFSGNMGRILPVRSLLEMLMEKNALMCCVLTSQCISNVPTALLLSGFTENWEILLAGTNIGGLGTPVASLASLISLKFYMREPNANVWRYLGCFFAMNATGLLVLMVAAFLL